MPSAAYATLCKGVVRNQRDFLHPRTCSVSTAAAAGELENGMAAPPHSSTRHGRSAHALAPPVPQKASEKSGLPDEPKIGALCLR
jgi:hypothetical protein